MTEEQAVGRLVRKKRLKQMYSGLCETCGSVFFSFSRMSLFCTSKCLNDHCRTDIVCVECARSFRAIRSRARKFCGKICSNKLTARKLRLATSVCRYTDHYGYIVVTDPRFTDRRAYIPEHRLVMENSLGRKLRKGENVHHKNGIRNDNRIENLELWAKPQVPGQRVKDLIAWVVDNYKEATRLRIDVDDAVEKVLADIAKNKNQSIENNAI